MSPRPPAPRRPRPPLPRRPSSSPAVCGGRASPAASRHHLRQRMGSRPPAAAEAPARRRSPLPRPRARPRRAQLRRPCGGGARRACHDGDASAPTRRRPLAAHRRYRRGSGASCRRRRRPVAAFAARTVRGAAREACRRRWPPRESPARVGGAAGRRDREPAPSAWLGGRWRRRAIGIRGAVGNPSRRGRARRPHRRWFALARVSPRSRAACGSVGLCRRRPPREPRLRRPVPGSTGAGMAVAYRLSGGRSVPLPSARGTSRPAGRRPAPCSLRSR